jgi:hypothetical protein
MRQACTLRPVRLRHVRPGVAGIVGKICKRPGRMNESTVVIRAFLGSGLYMYSRTTLGKRERGVSWL